MCGIIGAASSRSVGKILIKGLQLMEYRGYDSAGVVLNKDEEILRLRSCLLYTSPSPRDPWKSRMPSSA